MSKLRWVPFRVEHAEEMLPSLISDMTADFSSPIDWAEQMELTGICLTLKLGDVPVLAGGLILLFEQTAEARILMTAYCRNNLSVLRMTKRIFMDLIEKNDIKRTQCGVHHGLECRERWMKFLGFEYETSLERFFPDGQSIDLYRILRD